MTSKSSFKLNLSNAACEIATPAQTVSNIAVIGFPFSFVGKFCAVVSLYLYATALKLFCV
jgi:hypothetical protein